MKGARITASAAGVLVCLVAAVFAPALVAPFIHLDDPSYLLENARVRAGLSLPSVRWALTSFAAANWHPLTWVSHMLDVELFGLAPAGHHVSSLVLHALATVLLFLVLSRMAGSRGTAFVAAALWAVHPLRVESVAWAAQRKDVLAGAAWLIALLLYLGHVRRPRPRRYAAVVFAFALAIMAKPTVVTLPIILLLVDWWPLGRFHDGRGGWPPGRRRHLAIRALQLLREKVPLFLLSTLAGALTLKAQSAGQAVVPLERVSAGERTVNAAASLVTYFGQAVWPADLAIYYPLPTDGPPLRHALGAGLCLLAAIGLAAIAARKRPAAAFGWLWFLASILPMLGLVQVGIQARADRYTYLPSMGLVAGLVWTAAPAAARGARLRLAAVLAALLIAAGWGTLTVRYLDFWRDGETLFRRALAVAPDGNWMAHFCLGVEIARRGRVEEATREFERAVTIEPSFVEAHYNLGLAYDLKGEGLLAEREYRETLRLRPDYAEARNNLGILLARRGETAAAVEEFRAALRFRPGFTAARDNLERALGLLPPSSEDPHVP